MCKPWWIRIEGQTVWGIYWWYDVIFRDIARESEIVEIPRGAMIDIDRIKNDPIMKWTKSLTFYFRFRRPVNEDLLMRSNQNMAVALFLCSEKLKPSSQLTPYINFLPSRNPVPLFFTADELQVLNLQN